MNKINLFTGIIATALLGLSFSWAIPPAVAAAEQKAQFVIRQGDGGSQRERNLGRIAKILGEHGCPVNVTTLTPSQPTPPKTALEFSHQTHEATSKRLPNFHLGLFPRTIDGKTKVGAALVLHKAVGITELAMLDGESIGFVSKDSPAGYLEMRKILEKAGVKEAPEKNSFGDNHVGTASLLLHKEIYAAVVATPMAEEWVEFNGLVIIARTAELESGGLWINNALDPVLAKKCSAALAGLKEGLPMRAFPQWIKRFEVVK